MRRDVYETDLVFEGDPDWIYSPERAMPEYCVYRNKKPVFRAPTVEECNDWIRDDAR